MEENIEIRRFVYLNARYFCNLVNGMIFIDYFFLVNIDYAIPLLKSILIVYNLTITKFKNSLFI